MSLRFGYGMQIYRRMNMKIVDHPCERGAVVLSKKELRRAYLARRSELSNAERQRLSTEICRRITSAPWFDSAKNLLMYMPFRQEVDIRPLMDTAWEEGKTVFLPKSEPKTKAMNVYQVEGVHTLTSGAYGILEPVADERHAGKIADLDIVFVPGVVFDRCGHRIGYGGGYFDRFLPKIGLDTLSVGVAFSLQVVDKIPHDVYDQQLHGLVTDVETLWFTS